MGRMLQALNQNEGKRSVSKEPVERRPAEVAPPACAEPEPPEAELPEEPEEDASVPFIEVGGPRHLVHASLEVIPLPRPAPVEAAVVPPEKPPEPAASDEEDDDVAGTVSIYCSWTLRRGLKQAG